MTSALWINGSHVNKIGKKIQFFLGYWTGKYGSSEWEISCLKRCSSDKNLQEMAFCNSICSLYGFFLFIEEKQQERHHELSLQRNLKAGMSKTIEMGPKWSDDLIFRG